MVVRGGGDGFPYMEIIKKNFFFKSAVSRHLTEVVCGGSPKPIFGRCNVVLRHMKLCSIAMALL